MPEDPNRIQLRERLYLVAMSRSLESEQLIREAISAHVDRLTDNAVYQQLEKYSSQPERTTIQPWDRLSASGC